MVNFSKKFFIFFLIFIVLFFLLRIGFLNFLGDFFKQVIVGLNSQALKTIQFLKPIFIKRDLLQENKNLENKILQLQAENISLKTQFQENVFLKKQLKFLNRQRYNFVLANIIGQKLEAGFNWYIIDRGTKDNLRPGLAVMVDDGYLVGKILRAEENYSYFVPILNNHFSTSVDFLPKNIERISTAKVTSGLVQGKYDLILEADLIPVDKDIAVGDYLITSGLENEIPRGLIIGEVESIEKKIDTPFQKAIVKPLISPADLRIVVIPIP
ncbi:MAG: rod shape-determining protein MreC [Patescibacteria group bacterium]